MGKGELLMFENIISLIKPLHVEAMEKCQIRLDNLTKPLGSLHSFEHIAKQLAGVTGNERPKDLKKSIIVMAADHGVVESEVSLYSPEVTVDMVVKACQGVGEVNVFAQHVDANLVVVDIGVGVDLPVLPQLRAEKIAYGTKNITQGPAMRRDEVMKAIHVGINIAQGELEKGSLILGIGAMGIGSTIPSTGIIASYSTKNSQELLGLDTGITEELLRNRIAALEKALAVNPVDINDPLTVLSQLGGLEIAGLVGVILGAAAGGAVVVLDGLVTSAAALIAVQMAPQVKEYLIASHFAVEPAHKIALDLMEVPGYLDLGIHFGEGIGAALGISLINASLHVLNDMKTFGAAEVAVAQDGPGSLKQNKNII